MTDIFSFIKGRTSGFTKYLDSPAPSRDQIIELLSCATSAPDHGGLTAWRFAIMQGNDLEKFANLAVEYFIADNETYAKKSITPDDIKNFKLKILRAPSVVAVWASPSDRKPIPKKEQVMSVSMAVAQILLAAYDKNFPFAAVFLTGFIANHRPLVDRAFGLMPDDEFLGYIYIGSEKLPDDKITLPQKKRLPIDNFIMRLKDG
ncbi:MAG: nitroreductase family protein [Alphaproteobacteria bacterium]